MRALLLKAPFRDDIIEVSFCSLTPYLRNRKQMALFIASDHGGYSLKQEVIAHLQKEGIDVHDLGTENGTDSVDYPDYASKVAEEIAENPENRGILICGTGIGISIAANKHKGIRAALCNDVYSAKMSRLHNDANILVLGGRVIGPGIAIEIVKVWLATDFEGERHLRRVNKIHSIETQEKK